MSAGQPGLLFISAHLPSREVPQAGQRVAYDRVRELAQRFDVTLVSFFNEAEAPYAQRYAMPECRQVALFPVSRWSRLLAVLTHPLLPIRATVRMDGAATRHIRSLLARERFAAVHCEFTAAAAYLNLIGPGVRTSVTEIDLTYQLFERQGALVGGLAGLVLRSEAGRQKRWELGMLRRCDEIIVLSDKDRRTLVADGIPDGKISVRVPTVDPMFTNVDRSAVEPGTLLFWGALDRPENADAVLWFAHTIFPAVQRRVPGAKLIVAGASPPPSVLALNGPAITVTGFVADPLEYFRRCQLGIAPLRRGAGIKLKVLEYLAAGLPVVASPIGAEGIEHPNLIVADGETAFEEQVVSMLQRSPAASPTPRMAT